MKTLELLAILLILILSCACSSDSNPIQDVPDAQDMQEALDANTDKPDLADQPQDSEIDLSLDSHHPDTDSEVAPMELNSDEPISCEDLCGQAGLQCATIEHIVGGEIAGMALYGDDESLTAFLDCDQMPEEQEEGVQIDDGTGADAGGTTLDLSRVRCFCE